MTQTLTPTSTAPVEATDLSSAIRQVLAKSSEPLSVPKIRSALPPSFRQTSPEELTEGLRRQAAAGALVEYPKYRSQHERYWDRPMPVHAAALLQAALEEKPLAWSELRRKLPAYAQNQAQLVLDELLAKKTLYRHPRLPGSRGGELFGQHPAAARDYLRLELTTLFGRLQDLGFSQDQLRSAAIELLHDEEWSMTPAATLPEGKSTKSPAAAPTSAPRQQTAPNYEWKELAPNQPVTASSSPTQSPGPDAQGSS
jgi:hypothetical protein